MATTASSAAIVVDDNDNDGGGGDNDIILLEHPAVQFMHSFHTEVERLGDFAPAYDTIFAKIEMKARELGIRTAAASSSSLLLKSKPDQETAFEK